MDTEKKYYLNGQLNGITFYQLNDDELNTSQKFVEMTRHLQEINQLYSIFKFNIECLQKKYILMGDGDTYIGEIPAGSEEDFIRINSHIINIISSGKTLVDSIESYIKCCSTYEKENLEFLEIYHNTYDTSFSYRLLTQLRNYSQHGHLPVSKSKNNYYFDLNQIFYKPHFKHNTKLKHQMQEIIEEIETKYKDSPTLSLTRTIAEYIAKLLFIYKTFWIMIEKELNDTFTCMKKVIEANPENLYNELFIYNIELNTAHAIPIHDNPNDMINQFKTEASNICSEYTEAYEKLINNSISIRYNETEQRIEVKI